MKEPQYEMLQNYYKNLEEALQAVCTGLPFHLDGPEYDVYCYMILHPFRLEIQKQMLEAAEVEDFEKALACQRFIRDRLSKY